MQIIEFSSLITQVLKVRTNTLVNDYFLPTYEIVNGVVFYNTCVILALCLGHIWCGVVQW